MSANSSGSDVVLVGGCDVDRSEEFQETFASVKIGDMTDGAVRAHTLVDKSADDNTQADAGPTHNLKACSTSLATVTKICVQESDSDDVPLTGDNDILACCKMKEVAKTDAFKCSDAVDVADSRTEVTNAANVLLTNNLESSTSGLQNNLHCMTDIKTFSLDKGNIEMIHSSVEWFDCHLSKAAENKEEILMRDESQGMLEFKKVITSACSSEIKYICPAQTELQYDSSELGHISSPLPVGALEQHNFIDSDVHESVDAPARRFTDDYVDSNEKTKPSLNEDSGDGCSSQKDSKLNPNAGMVIVSKTACFNTEDAEEATIPTDVIKINTDVADAGEICAVVAEAGTSFTVETTNRCAGDVVDDRVLQRKINYAERTVSSCTDQNDQSSFASIGCSNHHTNFNEILPSVDTASGYDREKCNNHLQQLAKYKNIIVGDSAVASDVLLGDIHVSQPVLKSGCAGLTRDKSALIQSGTVLKHEELLDDVQENLLEISKGFSDASERLEGEAQKLDSYSPVLNFSADGKEFFQAEIKKNPAPQCVSEVDSSIECCSVLEADSNSDGNIMLGAVSRDRSMSMSQSKSCDVVNSSLSDLEVSSTSNYDTLCSAAQYIDGGSGIYSEVSCAEGSSSSVETTLCNEIMPATDSREWLLSGKPALQDPVVSKPSSKSNDVSLSEAEYASEKSDSEKVSDSANQPKSETDSLSDVESTSKEESASCSKVQSTTNTIRTNQSPSDASYVPKIQADSDTSSVVKNQYVSRVRSFSKPDSVAGGLTFPDSESDTNSNECPGLHFDDSTNNQVCIADCEPAVVSAPETLSDHLIPISGLELKPHTKASSDFNKEIISVVNSGEASNVLRACDASSSLISNMLPVDSGGCLAASGKNLQQEVLHDNFGMYCIISKTNCARKEQSCGLETVGDSSQVDDGGIEVISSSENAVEEDDSCRIKTEETVEVSDTTEGNPTNFYQSCKADEEAMKKNCVSYESCGNAAESYCGLNPKELERTFCLTKSDHGHEVTVLLGNCDAHKTSLHQVTFEGASEAVSVQMRENIATTTGLLPPEVFNTDEMAESLAKAGKASETILYQLTKMDTDQVTASCSSINVEARLVSSLGGANVMMSSEVQDDEVASRKKMNRTEASRSILEVEKCSDDYADLNEQKVNEATDFEKQKVNIEEITNKFQVPENTHQNPNLKMEERISKQGERKDKAEEKDLDHEIESCQHPELKTLTQKQRQNQEIKEEQAQEHDLQNAANQGPDIKVEHEQESCHNFNQKIECQEGCEEQEINQEIENGIKHKAEQYSPEAGQYSPKAGQYSPEAEQYSPKAGQYSPKAGQYSPEAEQYSPKIGQFSPKARQEQECSKEVKEDLQCSRGEEEEHNQVVENELEEEVGEENGVIIWNKEKCRSIVEEEDSENIVEKLEENQDVKTEQLHCLKYEQDVSSIRHFKQDRCQDEGLKQEDEREVKCEQECIERVNVDERHCQSDEHRSGQKVEQHQIDIQEVGQEQEDNQDDIKRRETDQKTEEETTCKLKEEFLIGNERLHKKDLESGREETVNQELGFHGVKEPVQSITTSEPVHENHIKHIKELGTEEICIPDEGQNINFREQTPVDKMHGTTSRRRKGKDLGHEMSEICVGYRSKRKRITVSTDASVTSTIDADCFSTYNSCHSGPTEETLVETEKCQFNNYKLKDRFASPKQQPKTDKQNPLCFSQDLQPVQPWDSSDARGVNEWGHSCGEILTDKVKEGGCAETLVAENRCGSSVVEKDVEEVNAMANSNDSISDKKQIVSVYQFFGDSVRSVVESVASGSGMPQEPGKEKAEGKKSVTRSKRLRRKDLAKGENQKVMKVKDDETDFKSSNREKDTNLSVCEITNNENNLEVLSGTLEKCQDSPMEQPSEEIYTGISLDVVGESNAQADIRSEQCKTVSEDLGTVAGNSVIKFQVEKSFPAEKLPAEGTEFGTVKEHSTNAIAGDSEITEKNWNTAVIDEENRNAKGKKFDSSKFDICGTIKAVDCKEEEEAGERTEKYDRKAGIRQNNGKREKLRNKKCKRQATSFSDYDEKSAISQGNHREEEENSATVVNLSLAKKNEVFTDWLNLGTQVQGSGIIGDLGEDLTLAVKQKKRKRTGNRTQRNTSETVTDSLPTDLRKRVEPSAPCQKAESVELLKHDPSDAAKVKNETAQVVPGNNQEPVARPPLWERFCYDDSSLSDPSISSIRQLEACVKAISTSLQKRVNNMACPIDGYHQEENISAKWMTAPDFQRQNGNSFPANFSSGLQKFPTEKPRLTGFSQKNRHNSRWQKEDQMLCDDIEKLPWIGSKQRSKKKAISGDSELSMQIPADVAVPVENVKVEMKSKKSKKKRLVKMQTNLAAADVGAMPLELEKNLTPSVETGASKKHLKVTLENCALSLTTKTDERSPDKTNDVSSTVFTEGQPNQKCRVRRSKKKLKDSKADVGDNCLVDEPKNFDMNNLCYLASDSIHHSNKNESDMTLENGSGSRNIIVPTQEEAKQIEQALFTPASGSPKKPSKKKKQAKCVKVSEMVCDGAVSRKPCEEATTNRKKKKKVNKNNAEKMMPESEDQSDKLNVSITEPEDQPKVLKKGKRMRKNTLSAKKRSLEEFTLNEQTTPVQHVVTHKDSVTKVFHDHPVELSSMNGQSSCLGVGICSSGDIQPTLIDLSNKPDESKRAEGEMEFGENTPAQVSQVQAKLSSGGGDPNQELPDGSRVSGVETAKDVGKICQPADVVSGDNKPFACPQCSYRAKKMGQLRKHLGVHRVYCCAHCDFTCGSHDELEDHMLANHPSRCGRKLCKKCHVLFRSDALDSHERDCTGEKRGWDCQICGKKFKFVSAMRTHLKRWHSTRIGSGQLDEDEMNPSHLEMSTSEEMHEDDGKNDENNTQSSSFLESDLPSCPTQVAKGSSSPVQVHSMLSDSLSGCTDASSALQLSLMRSCLTASSDKLDSTPSRVITPDSKPVDSLWSFDKPSSPVQFNDTPSCANLLDNSVASLSSNPPGSNELTLEPSEIMRSVKKAKTFPLQPNSEKPFLCSVCSKHFKSKKTLTSHSLTKHGFKPDLTRCRNFENVCDSTEIHPTAQQKLKGQTEIHLTPTRKLEEKTEIHAKVPEKLKEEAEIHRGTTENLKEETESLPVAPEKLKVEDTCEENICSQLPGEESHVSLVCFFQGCGRHFKKLKQLRKHEEKHAADKPYKCNWAGCRKAFLHLDNLRLHYQHHTEAKPFQCNQCSLGYWQKCSLKSHQLKVHGSSSDGNTEPLSSESLKSVTCPEDRPKDDAESSESKSNEKTGMNVSSKELNVYEFCESEEEGELMRLNSRSSSSSRYKPVTCLKVSPADVSPVSSGDEDLSLTSRANLNKPLKTYLKMRSRSKEAVVEFEVIKGDQEARNMVRQQEKNTETNDTNIEEAYVGQADDDELEEVVLVGRGKAGKRLKNGRGKGKKRKIIPDKEEEESLKCSIPAKKRKCVAAVVEEKAVEKTFLSKPHKNKEKKSRKKRFEVSVDEPDIVCCADSCDGETAKQEAKPATTKAGANKNLSAVKISAEQLHQLKKPGAKRGPKRKRFQVESKDKVAEIRNDPQPPEKGKRRKDVPRENLVVCVKSKKSRVLKQSKSTEAKGKKMKGKKGRRREKRKACVGKRRPAVKLPKKGRKNSVDVMNEEPAREMESMKLSLDTESPGKAEEDFPCDDQEETVEGKTYEEEGNKMLVCEEEGVEQSDREERDEQGTEEESHTERAEEKEHEEEASSLTKDINIIDEIAHENSGEIERSEADDENPCDYLETSDQEDIERYRDIEEIKDRSAEDRADSKNDEREDREVDQKEENQDRGDDEEEENREEEENNREEEENNREEEEEEEDDEREEEKENREEDAQSDSYKRFMLESSPAIRISDRQMQNMSPPSVLYNQEEEKDDNTEFEEDPSEYDEAQPEGSTNSNCEAAQLQLSQDISMSDYQLQRLPEETPDEDSEIHSSLAVPVIVSQVQHPHDETPNSPVTATVTSGNEQPADKEMEYPSVCSNSYDMPCNTYSDAETMYRRQSTSPNENNSTDSQQGTSRSVFSNPYSGHYPLLSLRTDHHPLQSLEGLASGGPAGSVPGSFFDPNCKSSGEQVGGKPLPGYGGSHTFPTPTYVAPPAPYTIDQTSLERSQEYNYIGSGRGDLKFANSQQCQDEISGMPRSLPLPSALPSSNAISKDFFGQYFQDPGHLQIGQEQRSQGFVGQQTGLSALQRSNSEFFRCNPPALLPGAPYSSVPESLLGMKHPRLTQPPTTQSQHWPTHEERTRPWDQVSPMIVQSENSQRNSYGTANRPDYSLDASGSVQTTKRMESSFHGMSPSVLGQPDLYGVPGAYSLTYSPTAASTSYSRTLPASQKHLEEAYRHAAAAHISDYRTFAAQAHHAPLPDVYGAMGINPALSEFDRYYYSARDAMYRSQQLASAMPHPFMQQGSTASQMGMPYTDRATYGREPVYGQPSPYGFMCDKQYLSPPTSSGGKMAQGAASTSDYLHSPMDQQDPYRRSVIYNMMPRYF